MTIPNPPATPQTAAADRRTTEGLRRLIAFTDAVVAIALTLLVLPLTDLASEPLGEPTFAAFVDAHQDILIAFAISFTVIWVLWRQHHRLIEYFASYDPTFIRMHFVWLATIVVMPFTTALISVPTVKWASSAYIGVLLISVGMLALMRFWGIRHPGLLEPGDSADEFAREGVEYASLVLLTIALIISLIWPATEELPLLLLFLGIPLGKLQERRRARAAA